MSDNIKIMISDSPGEFDTAMIEAAYTFWKSKIESMPNPSKKKLSVNDGGASQHRIARILKTLKLNGFLAEKKDLWNENDRDKCQESV